MENNISHSRPLHLSLKEYARGITGGLLFSFPLLYTMEMWWAGFSVSPLQLLLLLLITYVLLLGYNRFAGMHPGVSWRSVAIDSVEELGLGIILSFLILLLLNQIELGVMPLHEIMGKVILEASAVSIGVSIGTAQLGESENFNQEKEPEDKDRETAKKHVQRNNKAGIAILAICGSILIGANVAPTEEVLLIASEAEPLHILMMAFVSVLLSIIIVYFSNFKDSRHSNTKSLAYNIAYDTSTAYVIALAAAAFLLWFFGSFNNVSFWNGVSQVVVLGVLTSLGASAGRLLID